MCLIQNVKGTGNGGLWLFHIQCTIFRKECFGLPAYVIYYDVTKSYILIMEAFLIYPLI